MNLVDKPFKLKYIADRLIRNVDLSETRFKLTQYLKENDQNKIKYILLLLEIGSQLQNELVKLESTRAVDLKRLSKIIAWKAHPLIQIQLEKGPFSIPDGSKKLRVDAFLIWQQVINDIMLRLEVYISTFAADVLNTTIPDASLAELRTANPESKKKA